MAQLKKYQMYINGEWVLMMSPCELEAGAMEPVKMLSASNTPLGEVQEVIYRKRAFRMNTMDIAARTVAFRVGRRATARASPDRPRSGPR